MRLGIKGHPEGKIVVLSILTMKMNYKISKSGANAIVLMLLNIIRKHSQR